MKELIHLHCTPVTANTPRLTGKEINQFKTNLTDWEIHTKRGVPRLEKTFKFNDFNQALAFTDRIARLADIEDHHPAILTEWGKVTVTWWTHRINGLYINDFIMAAKTDQLM
jgi:4a-hydroxytetrahydrobiopterin dehydratase